MQSVSDPLNLLHEDGSWFARAHELRFWLVRHDQNLRGPVLTLLPKLEFHADNASAWPVLPDPHTRADRGWQRRANRLVEDWQRRVEAFSKVGIEQGHVVAVQSRRGLDAFRAVAAAIGKCTVEPLRGLVVVLAPMIVEEPAALESALTELMGDLELQHCRWVLALDLDAPPPRVLLDALGPERSLTTVCRVDQAQQKRDLSAMLDGSDPARFGMAGPVGVTPLRRVDDPPSLPQEQRDAALRTDGIEPVLLDRAPLVRVKALQASIAMSEGRGPEAVQRQREARDLCADLGQPELWVILQVTLASYVSAAGQRGLAKRELRLAIERAAAHGLGRLHAQSLLALGMLHALDREPVEAVRAYTEAAQVAEQAGELILAVESWRTAGQLAAAQGHEQSAASALQRALLLASEAPPADVKGSSAPEAARQLATIYERRGMGAQAASLHVQADAMERGEELAHVGE